MYLITITKHDSVLNNNTIQVCFKEVQGTTKEFGSYNPPNNLCCEKIILSKPKYPLLMKMYKWGTTLMGNCEEELPKKPVGWLSDSWPTGYWQSTDS